MKVDGRCHCGTVTYEAVVDPHSVAICHCADCQMLTGTAFRANISASSGAFALLSGEPRIYIKTAESGAKRAHAFCADCGTPIYSSALDTPATYSLRVGCLRQRAELTLQLQRWCDSALPWVMSLEHIPRRARQ